jgi:hypothetical protein
MAMPIVPVGEEIVTTAATAMAARHHRITGPKIPVELWYSDAGEWLGLESSVAGGRRLRHRRL